ncbi:hypothetical protein [Priestia aryabhattai]
MKKLLLSIVLIFGLSAVTNVFVPSTTTVVEAKSKKIYDYSWKQFKKKWKKEMKPRDKKLAKIKNYGAKNTATGVVKTGKIKDLLYVTFNTTKDKEGDFGSASVIGKVDKKQNGDVWTAIPVLLVLSNPSLTNKNLKNIALKKLDLNTVFSDGEKRSYSYKGVSYTVTYDKHRNGTGVMIFTVAEE